MEGMLNIELTKGKWVRYAVGALLILLSFAAAAYAYLWEEPELPTGVYYIQDTPEPLEESVKKEDSQNSVVSPTLTPRPRGGERESHTINEKRQDEPEDQD